MTHSQILLESTLVGASFEASIGIVSVSWQDQVLEFLTNDLSLMEAQIGDTLIIEIPTKAIQLQETGKGKSTAFNRVPCSLQQIKRYELFTWMEVIASGCQFSVCCPTAFAEELFWRAGQHLELLLPNAGVLMTCQELCTTTCNHSIRIL